MLPAHDTPAFRELLHQQVEKRRTFAIISHPDAGKTTLTEKLLLYGGAIRSAGSVKAQKSDKHATSDWMDIEKQRGISVTSSAMQFEFDGFRINILDTPGHQDFSEDTYRVLVAADAAVMLIDAAKGVEAQTIKLFKVCTLRHIPIFTFINKMDREARDPFELMENIEEILGIKTYPMNWPIGCGKEFKGVFDRNARKVLAFSSDGRANGVKKVSETEAELGDPALDELLTPYLHQQLVDEIELLDGAAEEFDLDKVLRGELSPVFFGSALTNFGVEPFLENFLRLTSAPLARVDSLTGEPVDPCRDEFSAFIFKIQANMNKAHRDRIAFMRICSGKFERGMEAYHVQEGKNIKLATYASRCIENEVLMFLRRHSRTRMEVSLDEPLKTDWDGNELLLSDVLGTDPDMVSRGIEESAERQMLFAALSHLSPREQQIMDLRFGLHGHPEMTQKEVADILGISQSYISRLEKRILHRLHGELVREEGYA